MIEYHLEIKLGDTEEIKNMQPDNLQTYLGPGFNSLSADGGLT